MSSMIRRMAAWSAAALLVVVTGARSSSTQRPDPAPSGHHD